MKSQFQVISKAIFRTQSNIYDGAFFVKIVKGFNQLIIFAK